MERVVAAGYAPGNLFTDGDPSSGTPATVVDAVWLNDVQEEICNLIEGLGVALDGAQQNQMLVALSAYFLSKQSTTPSLRQPGDLVAYAGATVPNGCLKLPTAPTNISRTTYADLFAAINTTWGAGDGSTTFGMPYLPADHTIVQANSNLATVTVGELLAHYHTITGVQLNISPTSGSTYPANSPGTGVTTSTVGGSANLAAGVRFNFAIKY